MTIAFPLSLAAFALTLPIKNFAWRLVESQEISGLAGGTILTADLGPKYWQSRVALDTMPHAQAAEIQALIESLDGALSTIYFHDPRRPFPAYDPKGLILGANVVQIAEIAANNKEVKFKGLPAGYQIRRGDWFDRNFGANPVHRGYHRVASATVAANGAGLTDWIEFRPHFLPGAAVNDVITLKQPAALCKIIPKSFNEGQPAGQMNFGMAFDIRQVL